jgi:hypothetical protein
VGEAILLDKAGGYLSMMILVLRRIGKYEEAALPQGKTRGLNPHASLLAIHRFHN